MKKLPFILILFCSVILSQNINTKIDSLKIELNKDSSSLEKAQIYKQIINEFKQSKINYDSAFYYANIGYNFSINKKLPKLQVDFLNNIAIIYYNVGNYDKSLEYYISALELSEKIGYHRVIPSITNNIGDIYLIKKDYKKAEILFKKCLILAEQNNNPRLEALEYLNIGEIYYNTNRLNKSLEFINKGIEKYLAIGDTVSSNYYTLSRTLIALNRFEEAEQSSLKGMEIANKRNVLYMKYNHALSLSEIYSKTNRYKKAFYYKDYAFKYKDSIDTQSEFVKLEKLALNFQVKEQAAEIKNIENKNTFLKTIYILVIIGVILIITLVFRQLKIIRMTKTIHDIQYSLIKNELDKKNEIKTETSFFKAVKEGDNELKK